MSAWLASLSARDRRILAVGAVLAAAMLLWAFVWDPLARSREALRAEAADNAAALAWMRPAAERLIARGGVVVTPSADGRSLLARVDAGVREAGLASSLLAVEPQGSDRVRVQFGGADFDLLAGWLERAAAAGIVIEEFSAQRAAAAGRVDARLLLREGAR
ncbi:type II secretion system protein GspM [Rehaibacterium terrae]|jgi:type II secretory pathway component PulM|uniref:Type II secretion system protein M n=1 Tax=Rehaibacterium terrae TaxID=1341696 RepID=A0A7W8DER7_9GAMM|nr:type II secretion system protein GspM [Rehaibacterium terrae]MBB5015873.1 type II secretory pathway component PulM [Rehaibacterium terrae]